VAEQTKPINEARQFSTEELFFSVTDERGLIRFGNKVFSRVANYHLDQMIGRPHNLIRHPEMPRSPFYLLWDYLKKEKTVAAYVKNMASDGRYYWVLAAVVPIKGGFLSIRLKPSSDLLGIIEGVYRETLELEKSLVENGASPDDAMIRGLQHIVAAINTLGFTSYDQFIWHALVTEIGSREAILGKRTAQSNKKSLSNLLALQSDKRGDTDIVGNPQAMMHRECLSLSGVLGELAVSSGGFSCLHQQILPKANYISDLGETINLLALNSQIRSAAIGSSGRALEKIAESLAGFANNAIGAASQLDHRLRALKSPMEEILFQVSLAKLKVEMSAVFLNEVLNHTEEESGANSRSRHALSVPDCIEMLVGSFVQTAGTILPAVEKLQDLLDGARREVVQLQKLLRALAYVQLSGKVESSRYPDLEAFREIFQEIDRHVRDSHSVLADLNELLLSTRTQLVELRSIDFRELEHLRSICLVNAEAS
jgi:aerotaxis receptor